MGLLKKALAPAGKLAGKILTDGILAPAKLVKQRRQICKVCPHLIRVTGNCKKCGCFVEAKTEYLNEFCKIGKW